MPPLNLGGHLTTVSILYHSMTSI